MIVFNMPPQKIDVAVLLTCYNRKNKTINALNTLFDSFEYGCNNKSITFNVTVYLTDDGCTDGTAQEVEKEFEDKHITIIKADGNAFWAGGMRMAWQESLKTPHDFFLLINDDTTFKLECITELFSTNDYALDKFGKTGVYTGFVSSRCDESKITYGAKRYNNSIMSKASDLKPTGIPQECTMVNGNILLVGMDVVSSIGILDAAFIHAAADMDYGMRAHKQGFPVLTTARVCGYCENDHDNSDKERDKVLHMSIKNRKAYLDHPSIKQYHDSLVFFKRYSLTRYYLLYCSYYLNLYLPRLYYFMYKLRKH